MKKIVMLLIVVLTITNLQIKAQGSGDQYKWSPTNPSGTRFAENLPNDPINRSYSNYQNKSIAPVKSITPYEPPPVYKADDYIYYPNKKILDECHQKGYNALVEGKLDKAEQYFLQAIDVIGLENYGEYRRRTLKFRPEGFFQYLYYARERKGNYIGAIAACDYMLIYEPENTESANFFKKQCLAKLTDLQKNNLKGKIKTLVYKSWTIEDSVPSNPTIYELSFNESGYITEMTVTNEDKTVVKKSYNGKGEETMFDNATYMKDVYANWKYTYDKNNNVIKLTIRENVDTFYTYDYDKNGNWTTRKAVVGAPTGNMSVEVGGESQVITYY
jgi:hypothetical protein